MAFEVTIPQSVLVAALSEGFSTRSDHLDRYLADGEYLTIIVSDGAFTVPETIGGANVLGSKQTSGPGVFLAEWLTRGP